MRFHSTPESVENGDITILAIIETVVSVAIYVGIGLHFGTFRHLAWAILVAPLMLLRTQSSVEWGLKLFDKYIGKMKKASDSFEKWMLRRATILRFAYIYKAGIFGFYLWATTRTALFVAIVRFLSPSMWFFLRPLEALREIPNNWKRQCLCVDSFLAPELIPGLDRSDIKLAGTDFSFKSEFLSIKKGNSPFYLIAFIPYLLIGFLPPAIYRITFKATSIVYLPLIFVVHSTVLHTLETKQRLERFTKGEQEKFRRRVAVFILTIFVMKIGLQAGWINQDVLVKKFGSEQIANFFVKFGHWYWWQFSLMADAVLTFILFLFADSARAWLKAEKGWSEEFVSRTITTITFTRGTLAIFTIAELFYLVASATIPQTLKHFFP
jgi:hypothetical protein